MRSVFCPFSKGKHFLSSLKSISLLLLVNRKVRERVQSRKASFPWLVGNKQSFARFFTRSEKLQFSRLIRHFLGGSKQTRVKCINATFSHPIELLLELRKNSEKWPCCSIMKIDLGGHFTMFQKISHGWLL